MSLLTPAERSAKETAIREQGKAYAAQAAQLESEVSDLLKQQGEVPMTGQLQQGTKTIQSSYAGFSHNHRPVYSTDTVPNYIPYYSQEEQQKIISINSQIQSKQQELAKLGRETVPVQAPVFLQPDTKYSGGNVSVNYEGTLAARQAGFDVGSGLSYNLPETFQKEEDKRIYNLNKEKFDAMTTPMVRYDPFKPVDSGGLFDINTKAPKVAGYNPQNQRGYNPLTGKVTPQGPRKTIQNEQPVASNLSYYDAGGIDAGLAPETEPPLGASIKSVVSPIAYTPLRGTNITARNYNALKNQPATTENLLGIQKSKQVLPSILPTSSAFLSIPGIGQRPPELTQVQVDALTPGQYKQYQLQLKQYNQSIRQQNIASTQSTKEFIKTAQAQGRKELSLTVDGQSRTVPIGSAYRELVAAQSTGKTVSLSAPALVSLSEGLNISSNRINQSGTPDYFGNIKNELGFTTPIIAAKEQQNVGDFFAGFIAPAKNVITTIAALPKGFYKEATQGFGAGEKYYESEVKPMLEPTGINSILTGQPTGKSSAYVKGSLLGEAALFFAPTAAGKVLSRGKTGIESYLGGRQAKTIGTAISKQSDAPFSVIKTKTPEVYEFAQGLEPRSSAPSAKIEPLFRIGRKGERVSVSVTPKEVNIPAAQKIEPQQPLGFIGLGKKGVTALVERAPLTRPKNDIGALIRGEITKQQAKRIGAVKVSAPESPVNVYAVKINTETRQTVDVLANLREAEKSGLLKRVTDITLYPTRSVGREALPGIPQFYENFVKVPKTVGYYETINLGLQRARGRSSFGAPVGSLGFRRKLLDVGLRTSEEAKGRTQKPMKPFTPDVKVSFGGAGSFGRARGLTKQDKEIIRSTIPNLISPKVTTKIRADVFGPLNVAYPRGGTQEVQIDYGRSVLEPASITERRPRGLVGTRNIESISNIMVPQIKPRVTVDTKSITKQRNTPQTKTGIKQIPVVNIKPAISQISRIRQSVVPLSITGLGQKTPQVQGTKQIQRQVPRTELSLKQISPQLLKNPQRQPDIFSNRPIRFGGFGFGGGGSFEGVRRGRRTRKVFYTNPSDPLRAGVILAQGVPELESYSPKVFSQVDVLLGKSRKRNKYAGLDQPGIGSRIKDNLSKNLRINL